MTTQWGDTDKQVNDLQWASEAVLWFGPHASLVHFVSAIRLDRKQMSSMKNVSSLLTPAQSGLFGFSSATKGERTKNFRLFCLAARKMLGRRNGSRWLWCHIQAKMTGLELPLIAASHATSRGQINAVFRKEGDNLGTWIVSNGASFCQFGCNLFFYQMGLPFCCFRNSGSATTWAAHNISAVQFCVDNCGQKGFARTVWFFSVDIEHQKMAAPALCQFSHHD